MNTKIFHHLFIVIREQKCNCTVNNFQMCLNHTRFFPNILTCPSRDQNVFFPVCYNAQLPGMVRKGLLLFDVDQ